MDIKNYIQESTSEAAREAFLYASKIPADKISWKPLEKGRSALEICQELAMSPSWVQPMVENMGMPEQTEESGAAYEAEKKELTSVDLCHAKCKENLETMYEFLKSFPEERLKETIMLPFGEKQKYTLLEVFTYPLWNLNYHLGQFGYIQTLYGDTNMY